jgi:hypothetical protein
MHLDRSVTKPLLILALLFTTLNAFKPLCVDDTLYHYHAQQIARHPSAPYGFRMFWNDRPEPAVQVLAPVMMEYWWAVAINLFGERPFLWKLWLLPFALLLVLSLHALLQRFAPGYEMILTWMIVLSPVFLPSFNLMLDVPAAALILGALAVFFRAADQNSLSLSALAGLIGGIAAQTKYNGMIVPAVMTLYAVIFKKVRLGVVAALISASVFLLWEVFIVWRAGQSAFLAQSHTYGSVDLMAKYAYLAWPLVTIMGAVAPAPVLLALIALRTPKQIILAYAGFVILGYLVLAFVPDRFQLISRDMQTNEERWTLAKGIFSVYGIVFVAILGVALSRLLRLNQGMFKSLLRRRSFRSEWFLAGWLVFEIVAYFGLSPIPAVRRVLGILVVSTLIIGRLASRTVRGSQGRALVRRVAFAGMALGLLFYGVDFNDARTEKVAAEATAQRINDLGGAANAWYVARWGFQYYAERAGMKPVFPDESEFRPGDLLAISDGPAFTQATAAHINNYRLEPLTELIFEDRLPLGTMLGFYSTGIPIHHHEGPRRTVKIYRIVAKI